MCVCVYTYFIVVPGVLSAPVVMSKHCSDIPGASIVPWDHLCKRLTSHQEKPKHKCLKYKPENNVLYFCVDQRFLKVFISIYILILFKQFAFPLCLMCSITSGTDMLTLRFGSVIPFWIIFKKRLSGTLPCYLAREAPGISVLSGETAEAGRPLGCTHAPINLSEGKSTQLWKRW